MSTKKIKEDERKKRARAMVRYLKRAYPHPKSELRYQTQFQFLVAVMLSAQCTDVAVNKATAPLFLKYKTARDFVATDEKVLMRFLSSIPFYRNKTKAIIASAKHLMEHHGGKVPRTKEELVALPGVAYKTAHVVLGELFDEWEGIPTDTHVKRFARKFDLTENTDLTKISKDLERLIPKKDWKYVNNGLVLYGRYVCTARPHDCAEHPLTKLWSEAAHRWPSTNEKYHEKNQKGNRKDRP